MSTLQVVNATVERDGRPILNSASLSISSGDFAAIVGPNGSGKSTLLRVLTGLWKPSRPEGEVALDGIPLHTLRRPEIARRIAFVPQDTYTDFAFTVDEIVSMGRHPHRGRFDREALADREAITRALRQCDILQLSRRYVNTLSGGERQRVLLARCLAAQPEFILLDEPTASLDVEHSLDILHLCSRLSAQGHAVVISTHDLNAVARFAGKVVLLDRGSLAASGSGEEVLNPAVLNSVFGVETEVAFTRGGQRYYVFHKSLKTPNSNTK